MLMETHEFNLFADYFQFYLQDESVTGNLGDSWTEEAVERLLALGCLLHLLLVTRTYLRGNGQRDRQE